MPHFDCGINSLLLSLSTSFQPLCLCHTRSYAPTTSSHSVNSPLSPSITPITPSLSLPAQDLPLSHIFPMTDSLPASVLTPWTFMTKHFFCASWFLAFFIILFVIFGSVRQIKLAICQLLGARICKYSLSYRIVAVAQRVRHLGLRSKGREFESCSR